MERRNAGNGGFPDCHGIAPVQLVDGTDVLGPQQPAYSGWNHELRLPTIGQPLQGGEIQVIVVVMAEKHNIDTGKIVPEHTRIPAAARTGPGKWTGAFRPDRVGQHVETALLQEHRGMVDQRNPALVPIHERGWFRRRNVPHEGGGAGTAGKLPSQHIEKPARLRRTGIVEALSVKVLRKFGHTRPDESLTRIPL